VIKFFSLFSLSILILVCQPTFGMGFIPTDAIARETPDPKIMEDLSVTRIQFVRRHIKTYYFDFARIAALSNAELSSFCPTYGTLSEGRKLTLFTMILDTYIHVLPLRKKMNVPVPNPKTMSYEELKAHKLEYGDLAPIASKAEFYELISRFDEAQVDLKAREMLKLLQQGSVSATELHSLLIPGGIKKVDPIKTMKWILGNLKFCGTNPELK
jgi:hypothetical protein